MIVLENLTKVYHRKGIRTVVADGLNAVFPTGHSVALLGRNGAGKSSLLRMIAGTMLPTSGRVLSDGTVSWPVGFSGSFHKELTGAQNVRFVARIYGVDTDDLVNYVAEFAELGVNYHKPFGTYSSGMRSRLAMGASMGIDFDTYLVDEVTSVGDAAFKAKSQAVFRDRMRNSSSVVVSHSMPFIRKTCTMGALLERGKLSFYEDVEEAIHAYERTSLGRPASIPKKVPQTAQPEDSVDPFHDSYQKDDFIMDTRSHVVALGEKFAGQARSWPELQAELSDVSQSFVDVLQLFCAEDRKGFMAAFERASHALARMIRGYAATTSSYKALLEQGSAQLLEQGRVHFLDQCGSFLNTLYLARMAGEPKPATAADLPRGNVLMYRWTTFLKGMEVAEGGRLKIWSLKGDSPKESQFAVADGAVVVNDTGGNPTSRGLFAIRNGGDTLLIANFLGDPLVLHCFLAGSSADALRSARAAIATEDLSKWPAHGPVVPEGSDNYHAVHVEQGRTRGGKRFHPPVLLALAANPYWKFTRELRIADLVRKITKFGPSHPKDFDFLALCREPFKAISSITVSSYVTLYQLRLTNSHEDVFAFEGFGVVLLIGKNFILGDAARFRGHLKPYLEHFLESSRKVSESRFFYEIAKALFSDAVPNRKTKGLALSYGNWRVGDCSFALTSIRQMADLDHSIEILSSENEFLGFDPENADTETHVRKFFGDAACKRVHFDHTYVDGLSHLLNGNLGLARESRYQFQNRGRSYGRGWQKVMVPEFGGQRVDLLPGRPTVKRDPSRPFGIFFTLDLEKRRWLEQDDFIEALALWCAQENPSIQIHLNGMTSYRQPHRMGLPTFKTFTQEEKIVREIESRIQRKVPGFHFRSMAENTLNEKCRIIYDEIDYFIGPLGSGTVLPSVLYSKPGLIYSSNALYEINRDRYSNLDLLIGPYSELIPVEWSKDSDSRDHRFFPEAEMTNYSIPSDLVLRVVKAQLSFHLLKSA